MSPRPVGGGFARGSGEWRFGLPSGVTVARLQAGGAHYVANGSFGLGSTRAFPSGTGYLRMVTTVGTVAHDRPATLITGDHFVLDALLEIE